MHDFGAFCYLDPQKTGSTFVSDFLRRHSARPERAFRKHGRVGEGDLLPGAFCFITVRDPVEQYLSLYSYGLDRPATPVRRRLRDAGHDVDSLYTADGAGFERWFEILNAPQGPGRREGYGEAICRLVGFQSFRILSLAIPGPLERLARAEDRAGILRLWARHALPAAILRTAHLREDLARLVGAELRPHIRDPEAALEELRQGRERPRSSARVDRDGFTLDAALRRRIEEREWLIRNVLDAPLSSD